MMNFGTLKWFDSFIRKLEKNIGLYQSHDLHLWLSLNGSMFASTPS